MLRCSKPDIGQNPKSSFLLARVALVALGIATTWLSSSNHLFGQSFLEKLESVVREKINNPPPTPQPPNANNKDIGSATQGSAPAGEELPPPRRTQDSNSQNGTERMPSILDRDSVVPAPKSNGAGTGELRLTPAAEPRNAVPAADTPVPDNGGVYLGLEVEEITGGGIGVRIAALNENSPAWKAGFKVGDLLQAIDGHAIANIDGVADRLKRVVPGRPTKFLVKRGGRNLELTAVLQSAAVASRIAPTNDPADGPAYLGVVASDLTPAFRTQFGLAVFSGAAVTNVAQGSPAYGAGIRPGDAIVEVNGVPIDSADDLARWLGSVQVGQPAELVVYRGTLPNTMSLVLANDPRNEPAMNPRAAARPQVAVPRAPSNAALQAEVEQLRADLQRTQQQLLQTQQRLEQVLQQFDQNR